MEYRKFIKTKTGTRRQEKKQYEISYKFQTHDSKVIRKQAPTTVWAYNKEDAKKKVQRLTNRICFAFKVKELK